MQNNDEPKIGRFLFDSLTLGMYDNPLCVYREYIQNSADAIDRAIKSGLLHRAKAAISINIDPLTKTITIEDNGCGISNKDVKRILLNVGESEKIGEDERGFRGIGRLGGMAYCKELQFIAKAKDDKIVTVNTWDCKKIATMLNPNNKEYKGSSLEQVIKNCTSFKEMPANDHESFFKVVMKDVESSRNVLLDVHAVRSYLSEVAPVAFNYQEFPHGKQIDEKMKKEVRNFNIFKISINYEEIFKPYKLTVPLSQSKSDKITNIVEFDINDDDGKVIAKGWRAERAHFIGAILKTEGVEGIRVRVGNIQLGTEDLLDKVFKERRFNSYFIGEIHTINPNLVPNSRRDDFEDNKLREMFYTAIEKELGVPLSGIVREKSIVKNKMKVIDRAERTILEIKNHSKKGFVSDNHKKDLFVEARNSKEDLMELISRNRRNEAIKDIAEKKVNEIKTLLTEFDSDTGGMIDQLSEKYSKSEKETIDDIFNCIYENYSKAGDAVKLVELIVKCLNKKRRG